MRAILPGFFDVWFNSQSMVNILAWCDVSEHYRITTDTSVEDAIFVHISDITALRFVMVKNGLFLLDPSSMDKQRSLLNVYSFDQISVVRDLKSNFTRRKLKERNELAPFFVPLECLPMPHLSMLWNIIISKTVR